MRDIVRTPTREYRMGFMDKAKKLAEQAQEKLDEAQKNFNQGQSGSQPAEPGGVRYDEHGRPIQDATPAAATAPPSATPAADTPAAPAPPPEDKPAVGEANATPDPFKPIDQ
jgi:hypothetical protein